MEAAEAPVAARSSRICDGRRSNVNVEISFKILFAIEETGRAARAELAVRSVVRLGHGAIVERLVEHVVGDSAVARDLAE